MTYQGLDWDEQVFSERLATKKDILGNIIHFVKKEARKNYWDPQKFTLNRLSFCEFAGLIEREDVVYDGPFFQLVEEDVIYVLLTNYSLVGTEIVVETDVYKLEGYEAGNRRWQQLMGDEGWQDTGDDFFSLEAILNNEDEEWVERVWLGLDEDPALEE